MNSLCIFCGSSLGARAFYADKARELGSQLASLGITLVYGGGGIGLMGELASTVLCRGGKVVGVIPKRIHESVDSFELTELHVVEDMHARKAKMYSLADGFIILPGGIGTAEEFFEIYTWYQLGIHLKPIGLLNVEGYFAQLIGFIDAMVQEGFLKAAHREALVIENEPSVLLEQMKKKKVLYVRKT